MRLSGRGQLPLGAATLTVLVAAGTLLGTGPAPAAPDGGPGMLRAVEYRGIRLLVPRSWPVVDLARHPRTCARVDRHAVYLGAPRERADCPARITGRTESLALRPVAPGSLTDPTSAGSPRVTAPAGPAALPPDVTVLDAGLPDSVPASTDHSARWVVRDAAVLITATYGTHARGIEQIFADARLTRRTEERGTPSRRRVRPRSARPQARRAPTLVPGTVHGRGFDTCQAPTAHTMDTWLAHSDHRAVGVYIGGGDLGCPDQPHLSAGWVRRQTSKGWHIVPLYVGRQAPCSREPFRIQPGRAARQGRVDARDAAARAGHYGMAQRSIIIADMEYYPRGGSCSRAVLTYLSAWTRQLHVLHYRSGVYSSRAAAIDDLIAARRAHRGGIPGTIDFAQWDGRATTGEPHIPDRFWYDHHRIKQYRGGHNETHGGITLNVDSDWLDVT